LGELNKGNSCATFVSIRGYTSITINWKEK